MKFVPVNPGTSGDSSPHPERPSQADPYRSLAEKISAALVDDRCLLLVASEPLPSSWSIREALDALEQQLQILEIPCNRRAACAEIIRNLSRFISVELALGRLRGTVSGASGRTLIICDNAEQLDAQQLAILVRLVERTRGLTALLLLARSDAFLRGGAFQDAGIHKAVFVRLSFGQESETDGSEIGETRRTILPVRDTSSADLLRSAHFLPDVREHSLEGARTEKPEVIPPRWTSPAIAPSTITQLGGSARVKNRLYYAWLAVLFCVFFGFGGVTWYYTGLTSSGGKGNGNNVVTQAGDTALSETDTAKAKRAAIAERLAATRSAPALAPQHKMSARGDALSSPSNREEESSASVGSEKLSHPAPSDKGASQLMASASPSDIAALLERGEQLYTSGDIASARSYFERAANAGDARAALRMGETFDPSFFPASDIRRQYADATKADFWYRRAQSLANARIIAPPPDQH